ncbi:ElaB/YgaM/YqjD family protein [Desulfonatronum parangueonense]
MNKTVDQVSEKTHEAVDFAARMAGEAEHRLRDVAEQAQHGSHDLIEAVTEYVKENPLTALGIAFVAGSLLSNFTRRR